MARKIYPYSLDRHDAKIAGVCSTLGKRMGIDPTIVRIAFVATPLLTPMPISMALVIYAVIGVYLAIQKKREVDSRSRMSDFDRMDETVRRKPSVKAMRTELDVNDRRLMAIDHHLNSQNDELAREIEALRQEDK
jgi:phage shock protein C